LRHIFIFVFQALSSRLFQRRSVSWGQPAPPYRGAGVALRVKRRQKRGSCRRSGAYTRPLFSSTRAASDAKYTLNNPSYSPSPPNHPLNKLLLHPTSLRKRLR
jgi:hypothetical protein